LAGEIIHLKGVFLQIIKFIVASPRKADELMLLSAHTPVGMTPNLSVASYLKVGFLAGCALFFDIKLIPCVTNAVNKAT
jgi:hypothetical protein